MFLQLAFIAAYVAIAVGVGLPMVSWLNAQIQLTGLERASLSFGVGALVVHYGVQAVGWYRLDTVSMAALALVLALAAIMGLMQIRPQSLTRTIGAEVLACRQHPVRAFLWLATIGVATSALLQGLAPPNDYDSLMYHLALPKFDLEQGRMTIAWRWTVYPFYPSLVENQARMALALAGDGAAQMQHGMFGVMAAALVAGLVRRLGGDVPSQILGALMFLAIRVVIWEMATVEVDVALAAYTAAALVAYVTWREHGGIGAMVLFGAMIGGALNTKYHGFVVALSFAPFMLWDLAVRHRPFTELALGPATALVTFIPHMARAAFYTGNPVFPLFNPLFNPGGPAFLEGAPGQYGTGRGLLSFLRTPWDIFVLPMDYFDGMIFGAPYLLAFAPLAFLGRWSSGTMGAALTTTGAYYGLWFWLMPQQVRFLLPVFPALSALAAIGAVMLWRAVRANVFLAGAFSLSAVALVVNQAMFVGIYAALRLPPAVGLVTPERYHSETPTLAGASYKACTFIRDHLRAGERYLSLLTPHFYYCPLASAISSGMFDDEVKGWLDGKTPAPLTAEDFLRRLEEARIRFVIVQTVYENRRNVTGQPELRSTGLEHNRWGQFLVPALKDIKPLAIDRLTAVYDGPEVIEALRRHAAKIQGYDSPPLYRLIRFAVS
jgi:4-amino-4-deoxy-L-arabinose transferase-like glycosyltransferase